MESTSFHSVNADKGLNRLHKLLWLLNNLFENCISGIIPFGRIKITHFSFNPEKLILIMLSEPGKTNLPQQDFLMIFFGMNLIFQKLNQSFRIG